MNKWRITVAALLITTASCATGSPAAATTPQSAHAADFRVRMDLLFGESVLLLAKVASAAENHSDEYVGYITLLSSNGNDLARLVGQAFGNTTASQFSDLWNTQETGFVDYVIGVVTHDQAKANGAMVSLGRTELGLAQLFTGLLRMHGSLAERFSGQLAPVKMFIDDGFAQNDALAYKEIDIAFVGAVGIGDLLAPKIAAQFPDKFPGDVSSSSVVRRALVNDRLLERAYLETMVTDALVAGRTGEAVQALTTPGLNPDALASNLGHTDLVFIQAWQRRTDGLEQYASGAGQAARDALDAGFVRPISSLAPVPAGPLSAQLDATLHAVDDQRSKSYDSLPADDSAAASAMQPVADALAGAS